MGIALLLLVSALGGGFAGFLIGLGVVAIVLGLSPWSAVA